MLARGQGESVKGASRDEENWDFVLTSPNKMTSRASLECRPPEIPSFTEYLSYPKTPDFT